MRRSMRADQLLVEQRPGADALGRAAADRDRRRALARGDRLARAGQGGRRPAERRRARGHRRRRAALRLARRAEARGRAGARRHRRRRGWHCLDVGQSTGGFTDVLLQRGAARVVGVDVGHGQLHAAAARRPARDRARRRQRAPPRRRRSCRVARFDLIVGDLSFISLTLVLPALVPLLRPAATCCCWSSRSSSCSRRHRQGRPGARRGARTRVVEQRLRDACAGARPARCATGSTAPIAGGDGNREFFVHAAQRRHDQEHVTMRRSDQLRVLPAQHAGRQREAARPWCSELAALRARVLQRHLRRRRLDARQDARDRARHRRRRPRGRAAPVLRRLDARRHRARSWPPTARRTSAASSRCAATCPAARRPRGEFRYASELVALHPRDAGARLAHRGRRLPRVPPAGSATPKRDLQHFADKVQGRRRFGDHAVLLQPRRLLPLRRRGARARRRRADRAGHHAVPQLRAASRSSRRATASRSRAGSR